MTVSTTTNKATYIGNGVARTFPIPFPFLEQEHLKVYQLSNNDQTEQTDWTVFDGNIVFTTAPAMNTQIVIMREVPLTQETDYRENEILPAETLERNFDKLTMLIQQLKEQADRAVTVSLFSGTKPEELIEKIEVLYEIRNSLVATARNVSAIAATAAQIAEIKTVADHLTDEGWLIYEYLPEGAVVRIDDNLQEYAGLLFEEL